MCLTSGGRVASWQTTSEIGSASQIASVRFSVKYGRIQMHGSKITPCLNVDRRIAVFGRPIDWKYVVATTLTEMHHSMQLATARSPAAIFHSAWLADETNIETSRSGSGGTVWTAHAATHSAVVTASPSLTVSRTRPKFRAPQL